MDLFSLYVLYVFPNSEHVMAPQRTVSFKCRSCIKYAYAINEISKGKFPDLGKQSIQVKKVYRHFFFGLRYWNVERNHTHTQRKVNHDMERKQYI